MVEYLELKQFLLRRCQRFGSFLTLYIFLTVSGEAALCTLLGSAASYAYLALLCRDIDNVTGADRALMREAEAVPGAMARRLARLSVGIRMSAQPRLLIPVSLAAGAALFNAQSGDQLTLLEEACLFAGFLSYKGALVSKIWQDLRPKYAATAKRRPKFIEVEDELDIYGREKPKSVGLQEAERVLAEQEERKPKRG